MGGRERATFLDVNKTVSKIEYFERLVGREQWLHVSLPGQSDTNINSASSGSCIKKKRSRREDEQKLLWPAAKQKWRAMNEDGISFLSMSYSPHGKFIAPFSQARRKSCNVLAFKAIHNRKFQLLQFCCEILLMEKAAIEGNFLTISRSFLPEIFTAA